MRSRLMTSVTSKTFYNHHFRQPANGFQCLLYLFRPKGGIDSDAVPESVPCSENCARRNADPLLQSFLVKFERINRFRHFDPEDKAAVGTGNPRPLRDITADGVPYLGNLPGIDPAEHPQVVIITA